MIYDPPLSAFEEEVILEVASFKEEGLVTPKDEIEKKTSWKYVGPWSLWVKYKNADHYTIQTLLCIK